MLTFSIYSITQIHSHILKFANLFPHISFTFPQIPSKNDFPLSMTPLCSVPPSKIPFCNCGALEGLWWCAMSCPLSSRFDSLIIQLFFHDWPVQQAGYSLKMRKCWLFLSPCPWSEFISRSVESISILMTWKVSFGWCNGFVDDIFIGVFDTFLPFL